MPFDQLRRREFITLLAGAAASCPLAAHAQQPAIPIIGFLNSASADQLPYLLRAFHHGLRETGFVEGHNAVIEYRWAEDHNDRLPAMAADLARRGVTVIFANGPSALPAKAATATIPVVFLTAADPVAAGLVASMNRPGGNLTGVTNLAAELGPKRLELLHELIPAAAMLAALVDPTDPNAETLTRDLQTAANTLGVQVNVLRVGTEAELNNAFATLKRVGAGGLAISPAPFFTSHRQQLAVLAMRHAVPAIFQYREFAEAGGLMSYGSSITDAYRLAGVYTGRILKGEKPVDLPVQQATKVELIINLKTGAALGVTVPLALIGRADEVIE
jgi:putative tryptophan/tyrosine transport system substrate-binding protein